MESKSVLEKKFEAWALGHSVYRWQEGEEDIQQRGGNCPPVKQEDGDRGMF